MKKIEFTLNMPKEITLVNMCSGMVHHGSQFESDIFISFDGGNKVDMKSILGLMSLCMANGRRVVIEIDGKDEDMAYICIEKYVERIK